MQGLLGHAAKLALERLIDKLDKDEIPPAVFLAMTGKGEGGARVEEVRLT